MAEISVAPELRAAIESCFQDSDVRERAYYPDFRRAWESVLSRAAEDETKYFDINDAKSYVMHGSIGGLSYDFHIDQLKIAEWYEKEVRSRKQVVFFGKRLKRERRSGKLMFHDAECEYDPNAPESALDDAIRNIVACAVPSLPARMQIVFGNKWVEGRFNVLRRSSLSLFFIGTDYVPAFLATPFEAALYLFMMDCCIIKENLGKAKDEDIRPLLHIMRPSPMLRLKGLL